VVRERSGHGQQVQLANEAGARGVTIWKLGDEDPGFWTLATTK